MIDRAPEPPDAAPAAPLHQPYDIQTEQALLGALIRDNSLIHQAMGILDAESFYDPMHGRIYAQITAWALEGDRAINPLTLSAAMKSDPGVNEVGRDYFVNLMLAVPSRPTIRDYALIIRELGQRRQALRALDEARDALLNSPTSVRDALKSTMDVADMAERQAAETTFQTTYECGMDLLREAERASAPGGQIRGVSTGSQKLDDELGKMQGADFIVIAGQSGMGKSALMGGIAMRAAMAGYPSIFFSQEMKRKRLVARLIADWDFDTAEKAMWYSKFRTGGFSAGEFNRAALAIRALDEIPWLEIHDDDGLTVAQMYARARAFKAKWSTDERIRQMQGCKADEEPIGVVFNDYLQISDPGKGATGRNREQEVRDIARGHKAMAKRLDWPVVAGSQVNEGGKDAAGEKRPNAGDVRESKAIRHEADIILMPYREAVAILAAKPGASPGEPAWNSWNALYQAARHRFELIGAKNRDGRQFNLELWAEMASSAIRDSEVIRARQESDDDGLLRGFNPGQS